jgi:NhaP-type Na+/H+ or K+/H+ antiporter
MLNVVGWCIDVVLSALLCARYKHLEEGNEVEKEPQRSKKGAVRSVDAIKQHFKTMWVTLAEPLLFVLIGASVSVSYLNGEFVGYGLLILVMGLAVSWRVCCAHCGRISSWSLLCAY